jgi:hypothetical protein
LRGANTLAYLASSSAAKKKSFITFTPGVNHIKLFFFFVTDITALKVCAAAKFF